MCTNRIRWVVFESFIISWHSILFSVVVAVTELNDGQGDRANIKYALNTVLPTGDETSSYVRACLLSLELVVTKLC